MPTPPGRSGPSYLFQACVTAIETDGSRVTGVRFQQDGQEKLIPADLVWSTLPVSLLARFMRPEPPADVVEAARGMKFRGMILIYLILEQDQFSPTDAVLLPRSIIPILRMSEPKTSPAPPSLAAGPCFARSSRRIRASRNGS